MKESINRRSFVKTSVAATGAGLFVQNDLKAKVYIDGDDAIKIGLIGCGGRGTGAVTQALKSGQNVKLVAMADAFRDNVDKCYKLITDPEYKDWSSKSAVNLNERIDVPEEHRFDGFDSYKKVIELCDVVILTTPPGFRPIHFEAAVNAGKHIFTEKPMAVDAPGIRRVLKAAEVARRKKLNVVVGLQRHYQKIYTEWIDAIHNGAIGEIVTSRVYWNSAGVWVRERKAGQTEMEYQMRNWYYFNWLCGDHITEQHIHNLDVGNWAKQSYPVRAMGMGGREVRKGLDHGEIFDHHFIEYEYADGSRMFSQCRHIEGCASRVSEAFHGTNGIAPKPGVLKTMSGYTIMNHDDDNDPNPYQYEHDLLFEAIAKGEYKYDDADNGAYATMTAILGRMATYSGKIIEWDDALQSTIDLSPNRYAWDADPPVMPDETGRYPIAVPGQTKTV